MSDPSGTPWSDNPYAPRISEFLYFAEKENFAGITLGLVAYGIVIVLFFLCLGALLDPGNRRKGTIKWGLVVHTVAMFSFATVFTGTSGYLQTVAYIDNRAFNSADGVNGPGPLGYLTLVFSSPTNIVSNVMFLLNNWLADGLLLYRCFLFYAMNYWVIAFPVLVYFASLAMGIGFVYTISQPTTTWTSVDIDLGLSYYSISVSLNVLLTLMIVIRLVMHSRNVRRAMGAPASVLGLYKTIVTMLIESSAIYAVGFLLYIGPWAVNNNAADIFFPLLAGTQVIAPFLIILRVANKSALTGSTVKSGNVLGSMRFRGTRKSTSNGTFADGYPMSSVGTIKEPPCETGAEIETAIAEVPSLRDSRSS